MHFTIGTLGRLLRASYDVVIREILHSIGVRRRAILVGEGAQGEHHFPSWGSRWDFPGCQSTSPWPCLL